jgi:hypothetical protein
LTDDDLYAVQYLYGATPAPPLAGPVLAGTVAYNFQLGANPNLWIDAAVLGGGTLGVAWGQGAALVGGQSWRQITAGHIWLNVPEPAGILLFALGGLSMIVVCWRGRGGRIRGMGLVSRVEG